MRDYLIHSVAVSIQIFNRIECIDGRNRNECDIEIVYITHMHTLELPAMCLRRGVAV